MNGKIVLESFSVRVRQLTKLIFQMARLFTYFTHSCEEKKLKRKLSRFSMVPRLLKHNVLVIFAKKLQIGAMKTFKQPFKAQVLICFYLFLL